MNSEQIESALSGRCRGQFLGVYAKDTLPSRLPAQRPILLVCNTDKKSRPGTHWVSIFVDKDGKGEYFDSFGRAPGVIFARFLNRNCRVWVYNERQLQSVASYFCGQYCIFYCLYKSIGYDMNFIRSCFTRDTGFNDSLVHTFVCRMLSR
jgi:hypothetical protein